MAVPEPGVVRTEAMLVGDVLPTDQNSVEVVPSLSRYTMMYNVPAGVAPALGTRATERAPPLAIGTLVLPAATGIPAAVVNAGQEISRDPAAGVPSAR